MSNKKSVFFFLCPIFLSFILHFHVFNLDVIGYHVWRQSQTQTVIYNFTFSDNSILKPQGFDLSSGTATLLYEFPLYQWLIAQVNNVFGYSVMHTRTLSFFIFIFFLLGFFLLLKKFVSTDRALVTNSLLCFSPLIYYYCVNPLPDTLALCLATWSLYFFFTFLQSKSTLNFLGFSICIVLAGLVKLPYILFGGVFIVHALNKIRSKNFKQVLSQSLVLLVLSIPFLLWYVVAIPTWSKNGIAQGITNNSKSFLELLDFLQFNLISSVPELLTNYASLAFLVCGIILFFKNKKHQNEQVNYFVFVFILFSIYFFYELNMIEKVHDYYLMPFVPLIFLVVTYGLNYFHEKKYKKFIYLVLLISPLTAWLRIDQRWNTDNPGFTKDYLTYNKEIQVLIPINDRCIIDSDDSKFIALYYLKRKGYSLLEGELNPTTLKNYYSKGAKFLVTDNILFNEAAFPEFNFELLFSHQLKLYQLKQK